MEYKFLQEYKHLEQFCNQIYGVTNGGVTKYIDEMRSLGTSAKILVNSWEDDLHILINLRRLRNSLVHDISTTICTPNDLNLLQNFYNNLLTQNDPLSLYRKAKQSLPKKARPTQPKETFTDLSPVHIPQEPEKDNHLWIFISIAVCPVLLSLLFLAIAIL